MEKVVGDATSDGLQQIIINGALEKGNKERFRGCMTVSGSLGSGGGGVGGSLECEDARVCYPRFSGIPPCHRWTH